MGSVNIESAKQLLINAVTRSLSTMFPGYFGGDTKHTRLYDDYGYPENLSFENYWMMYKRNGIATAGVVRPIETCWQEFPELQEKEGTHDKSAFEKQIKKEFDRLQFWTNLAEADMYSRIGEYSGVIFRFRDNKAFDQPVDTVPGQLEGIAEIIPVLQGQLKPSEFYSDVSQENYGQVKMFEFTENSIGKDSAEVKRRQFKVHPDRVHIWSKNSSLYGKPVLEAGYNDLLNIQKIIGAGGEGFWKNAKSAPVMAIDKDANLLQLAQSLGAKDLEELPEKLNEVVADYQKGFDKYLGVQGMEAKTLNVTLPNPKEFFLAALQSFAASLSIPLKILLGSQTGERASTEDAKEWAKTCNARRTRYIIPNINRILMMFEKYGILPERDWYLLWGDLTEATTQEKTEIASKMSEINQKMVGSGGAVFDHDEIREVMGWKARRDELPATRSKEQPSDANSD